MNNLSDELFQFTDRIDVKAQLQADLEELHKCMKAESWKAAVILIGSLIECVLYYHIENVDSIRNTIPDFDKRNVALTDLLQWAHKHKIIDDSLFRLSEPIRDYRNLVHPRVQNRLKTEVTRSIVEIGYNVFLEVVRSAQKHRHALDDSNIEKTLSDIVQKVCNREITRADHLVYSPVIEKYGLSRGKLIVERSLEKGCKR